MTFQVFSYFGVYIDVPPNAFLRGGEDPRQRSAHLTGPPAFALEVLVTSKQSGDLLLTRVRGTCSL